MQCTKKSQQNFPHSGVLRMPTGGPRFRSLVLNAGVLAAGSAGGPLYGASAEGAPTGVPTGGAPKRSLSLMENAPPRATFHCKSLTVKEGLQTLSNVGLSAIVVVGSVSSPTLCTGNLKSSRNCCISTSYFSV